MKREVGSGQKFAGEYADLHADYEQRQRGNCLGELAPGERVASVRELAGEFEVNPNTMQRALNELEREGLLVSERTSGRFVTKDAALIGELKKRMASEAADKFRREMAVLGYSEQEMMDFFLKRCESAPEKQMAYERIG